MRSGYATVLRRGDVLSALIPYVLARLPLTMAPLALLLLVQSRTGSYQQAGLVCGLYAVAVAVGSPWLGRLVDRRGQRPVLLACGLVHPVAMVGTAFSAETRHYPLMLAWAAVAGLSLPPVTACMRVLWTRLLPDEDKRTLGFALEGIIVEVAELTGPLIISLMLWLGRPVLAVALAGLLMGGAALAFRSTTATIGEPVATFERPRWGALALPGVRRLLLVVLTSTTAIGGVEVAVTAYARSHGGMASAGLYIGAISAGGIVAGVLFGRSDRLGRRAPGLLVALLLMSALATASLSDAVTPAYFLASLVVFGATVSVGVIVQLALMSTVAADSVRAEAFTWGGTANLLGIGAGTAGAGWVIDHSGMSSVFLVVATPMVAAAVLTVISLRQLMPPAGAEERDRPALPADSMLVAVADLSAEVTLLKAQVAELESALAAVDASAVTSSARYRARRMLDRADAACLEMRNKAADDAERVRSSATTASVEILAAAERDARAVLDRARREADGILDRARTTAANAPRAPWSTLHALPAIEIPQQGPEAVAGS